MLSWVKDVLAHVKAGKERCSNSSVISTSKGGGEEPECAEDSRNSLEEEEFRKTNNDDHIRHLTFPTPPPSTSPSAPPSSHHSLSPTPSLTTRLSGDPAVQPPHVYPAMVRCNHPPTPFNIRPTPPSSISFVSLQDSSTSRNTSGNALSIPKVEMPLGSQQSPPVPGEDSSSVGQENQSQNTLQAAAGDVLNPTIDVSSYPSRFLTIALSSQIGQLVTVQDEKYVLVRVMGNVLKVSLNAGPCNIPPCRLVWRAGQPVPLVELPDSSFVEIDAVVCPESKRLHAAVIWQDTKPDICLQLLDDTYLFLDSRSVTCWPRFVNIFTKKLTILFDGTIVSAEVFDAVVFIGLAKATLVDLLQHNIEQCNATVYKVLEGTYGGRVLYVCTCLWVGEKPPASSLPMVINKRMLYTQESHGFYTKTEKKITLRLDVDASLCVSRGTATLQVDLDGSRKSLKAIHPLHLEPGCQGAGQTTRVSVHISKESLCKKPKNLVAFSAAMIKPSDLTVLGAILNNMPAGDLLSKAAPHCPLGIKDSPLEVCKTASVGHNAADQQFRVSSSLKASAPIVQKASVPAAQITPSTATHKTPNTVAQKTKATGAHKGCVPSTQKTSSTAAQNTSSKDAQKTSGSAAQKGSAPSTQKTSGTAAQKTSGTAAKTNKKSASLSQLSNTVQQWGYLYCRVLVADSCVAVVTAAGRKIIVAKGDLFVNEIPLTMNDNVDSILKKVPNLGVIYTQSQEVHQVHGHSVDLVTVVAWVGKKPSFINNIVEQRLSALKQVAAPNVTQAPLTALKMTQIPTAAPKGTPAYSAPLPEGATTVDATCTIMKISQDSVALVVRSKFLPGHCGTAHARLCDMYDNGTPMTQTEVEKGRDKVWHCQLKINNNGKHMEVPVAWHGKKPVNHASSKSTVSQQPRQALSTGDLTSSLFRPPGTIAFVESDGRQPPPSSLSKVLKGEVAEVLAEGGRLMGENGRDYLFSLEVCFLFGVCLHQVEPSEVLHVGMVVEFEVVERSCSRSSVVADEALVQRVWIEGEDASLALPPIDSMIDSWCSENGVSSATRDALMQETELLSPSLFPTALKMEATTTVTITS